MNIVNMLSWWQWLVMAAIPPLVVMLYFLKLRRVPVQVPSTYLWRKTLEDLHVNSIWQRLRQNLLLWLQLLILLAVILACLRPGYRSEKAMGKRSIFLIDNSLSMQANDLGDTRLQEAKRQALKMVDAMQAGDVAMVIAFSDRADVRQGYTVDKGKLRTSIDSIKPTNRVTDLTEALRSASGLANPRLSSQIEGRGPEAKEVYYNIPVSEAIPANIYVFTDGVFTAPQVDLGNLTPAYIQIGKDEANNSAIVAFTCQRNLEKPGQVEAFVRVQNFGSTQASGDLTLKLDGRMIDNANIVLEPGEIKGRTFEIEDLIQGHLELQLNVDDNLPQDNIAYAAVDPPRQLEVVLVTDGNTPLEAALATPQAAAVAAVRTFTPEEMEWDKNKELASSGTIDLFIYDGCSPSKMPESNTLFLGSTPPDESAEIPSAWKPKPTEAKSAVLIVDINRSHPLLQYVNFGGLLIAEGFSVELPTGGTELVRSNEGILMAVAPRDAYQDAVVGLSLKVNNTNWPNRPGFPIFLLNALEYLGGAVNSSGSKSVRPGQAAMANISSRFDKVSVQPPSGAPVAINRDGQPQIIFTQTEEMGVYSIKSSTGDQTLQMFTVNLFSDQESNIKPKEQIGVGLETINAQPQQDRVVRSEFWRWLLAIALVVLLVEWYLYNKRVAI
jgi:von Willebrand factor type A domain/Aerotolerance regulator N-terminal